MSLHLETRAIHAAAPELNGSRPVSVPIYQTSTFAFADPQACADALNDPDAGFAYSRYRNPTTRALEDAVADLEGGTASGSLRASAHAWGSAKAKVEVW